MQHNLYRFSMGFSIGVFMVVYISLVSVQELLKVVDHHIYLVYKKMESLLLSSSHINGDIFKDLFNLNSRMM